MKRRPQFNPKTKLSPSPKVAVQSPGPEDLQNGPSVAPQQYELLMEQITSRSGPLPDPQTLKEYQDLVPHSVERIFGIAERDQNFLHKYRFREQELRAKMIARGQIFGFALGVAGIGAAVVLALNDKDLMGAGVFFTALGALIATSIWGQKSRAQEKRQKESP